MGEENLIALALSTLYLSWHLLRWPSPHWPDIRVFPYLHLLWGLSFQVVSGSTDELSILCCILSLHLCCHKTWLDLLVHILSLSRVIDNWVVSGLFWLDIPHSHLFTNASCPDKRTLLKLMTPETPNREARHTPLLLPDLPTYMMFLLSLSRQGSYQCRLHYPLSDNHTSF